MMRLGFRHPGLIWALVVAQVVVALSGVGVMIVCHDGDGTSHIEIVRESCCVAEGGEAVESCLTDGSRSGSSEISHVQTAFVAADENGCVGSHCRDELMARVHVRTRDGGLVGEYDGLVDVVCTPTWPMLMAMGELAASRSFSETVAFIGAIERTRMSLRSTILIL